MSYQKLMGAKIPADVIERAKKVGPLVGQTIGDIIADATRPHLDRLEREGLARFRKEVSERTRAGDRSK